VSQRELDILSSIFPQLSTSDLHAICEAARLVDYPPQVMLCEEGRIQDTFYILVEGRADAYKQLEGEMLFINYMSDGQCFGEISLILDLPRTATIITATPTRVMEIDRAIFQHFVMTNPQAVIAITQMILKRFLANEEKLLTEIARLKRRELPPPRVFVSYSRQDQAFAVRLVNDLKKQKIAVWIDLYNIEAGKSWARQIGEALDACDLLLLILSPSSLASENVEDEWNYYLDQRKPVVPVLYQTCKIPFRLSRLQYLNFVATDYDLALARLVATLSTYEATPSG
jgi:CRP-like cAMP-binding protein